MAKPTLEQKVAEVERLAKEVADKTPKTLAPGTPKPEQVFGNPTDPPAVRKGENSMGSRGFSFLRLLKAVSTPSNALASAWEHSKIELEVCSRLRKAFGGGLGSSAFENGSFLAPFSTDLLPEEVGNDANFGAAVKSLVHAGVENADPQEMAWLARKAYGYKSTTPAQSWLDSTLGGALVGPPAYGELIDLFRNQEALINAGATVIPLPPTGRIIFQRQTNPTAGYWIGENIGITGTTFKTGQLILSAKKVACLLTLPNELLRFSSPAAEALARMDMTKTLALTFDLAALEGLGSDVKPLGLINTPNIEVVVPTTAASGNTGALLAPEDVYKFPSQIEDNNAVFEGFIMRAGMYYALLRRRVDAITAADKAGAFAFSPFRALGDNVAQKNINGFPVTTTPQVNANRVQGSTTTLSYILGGQFSDVLLAMFGAMEFAGATQGDTMFAQDQTMIRAILTCDSAVRHPGALAWCDKLQVA